MTGYHATIANAARSYLPANDFVRQSIAAADQLYSEPRVAGTLRDLAWPRRANEPLLVSGCQDEDIQFLIPHPLLIPHPQAKLESMEMGATDKPTGLKKNDSPYHLLPEINLASPLNLLVDVSTLIYFNSRQLEIDFIFS